MDHDQSTAEKPQEYPQYEMRLSRTGKIFLSFDQVVNAFQQDKAGAVEFGNKIIDLEGSNPRDMSHAEQKTFQDAVTDAISPPDDFV